MGCRHVLDEIPGMCDWVIIPPLFPGCVSIISCVRIWFTKLVHLSSYLWECAKCPHYKAVCQLPFLLTQPINADANLERPLPVNLLSTPIREKGTDQGELHRTGLRIPSVGKKEYFSPSPPAGRSQRWKAWLCSSAEAPVWAETTPCQIWKG